MRQLTICALILLSASAAHAQDANPDEIGEEDKVLIETLGGGGVIEEEFDPGDLGNPSSSEPDAEPQPDVIVIDEEVEALEPVPEVPQEYAPAEVRQPPPQQVVQPMMTPAQQQQAFARRIQPPQNKNAISVQVLALVFGELAIQYERALGNYVSVVAGVQMILFDAVIKALLRVSDLQIRGYGGLAGIRFYPRGQALRGLWLGPIANVLAINVKDGRREASGLGYNIGLNSGYSRHFGKFMMEASTVIGFQGTKASDERGEVVNTTGFWYGLRFALGVAF